MPKERLDERLQNVPTDIWLKLNQYRHSTRIEGVKLSDEDIEKMMRGLSVQKFADRDVQEVKGYYELLNNVFDAWKHLTLNEGTNYASLF